MDEPANVKSDDECLCPPGLHPYSPGCLKPEDVGENVTPRKIKWLLDESGDGVFEKLIRNSYEV